MGGAPNTSANLSCLGLKWHANFWQPRSGQLPVGRPLTRNAVSGVSDERRRSTSRKHEQKMTQQAISGG